jgi:signal peptidase I
MAHIAARRNRGMTNETQTRSDDVIGSEPPAVSSDEPPRRSRRRGIALFLRDILFIFLAALVISFLIKTFFIRSFYIPSGSMENTLQINDRVIVSLLTPGLTPLKHGDVVVFTDPGGWLQDETPAATPADSAWNDILAFVGLAAPDDNDHLIKRVIGLPGDHVSCCNALGQLSVNGVPLDEPYILIPPGNKNATRFDFSVTVPKNDLWVMGDNRYESADSAYHFTNHDATDFVPIKDVTGRAMVISWPASRWTYLDDYPLVFGDVDKSK